MRIAGSCERGLSLRGKQLQFLMYQSNSRSAAAASVATFAFLGNSCARAEDNISIATLLKGDWQIAGYTSTLDSRSAFILFRHPDEPYLVQCRTSYDVTRTPPVTSNCYKLQ